MDSKDLVGNALRKVINDRDTLSDYFKLHIVKTLLGFEMALSLISES